MHTNALLIREISSVWVSESKFHLNMGFYLTQGTLSIQNAEEATV
jgi:hypothetical protein